MSARVDLIPGEVLATLGTLPSGEFSCVVADPPYCSGGRTAAQRTRPTSRKYGRTGRHTVRRDFTGDSRDGRSWASWTALWTAEALRVAEPGAWLLCFADWRQVASAIEAVQWGGWTYRGLLPWDKGESARAPTRHFRYQAEFVVLASAGPLGDWTGPWPGVLRHTVKYRHDKFHECGKPTALLLDLLRCVRPGGRVLDLFSGSATTLVAARQLGLPALGIESNPAEYQNALDRLAALSESAA